MGTFRAVLSSIDNFFGVFTSLKPNGLQAADFAL